MSQYTTGEIAELCGITVRAVQYYDSRHLLTPSALSEGGRRLYSDEDVRKLKIICMLRNLDISISSIAEIFGQGAEMQEQMISSLLEQQTEALREEINDRKEKLRRLSVLLEELHDVGEPSVETIGDVASQLMQEHRLHRLRRTVFWTAVPLQVLELSLLILAFTTWV